MIEVKKFFFIRNSQKNCFEVLYVCIFFIKSSKAKNEKKMFVQCWVETVSNSEKKKFEI